MAYVTTRNFRSFPNLDNLLFIGSLFTDHYSSFYYSSFSRSIWYSEKRSEILLFTSTIHFRKKYTIHVHYSCHRKFSLRVFKIRVTVLVQERIHALSLGHFIQTRNSQHIIIRALAYYSTRRINKLILLVQLTIYVCLF